MECPVVEFLHVEYVYQTAVVFSAKKMAYELSLKDLASEVLRSTSPSRCSFSVFWGGFFC